tara:strand:+ start:395 stop:517 length:123 start_codon:yes stop_codon:yes gene_type:complete
MQIKLTKEERKKKVEQSLKNNLKKRKIFQTKIRNKIINSK